MYVRERFRTGTLVSFFNSDSFECTQTAPEHAVLPHSHSDWLREGMGCSFSHRRFMSGSTFTRYAYGEFSSIMLLKLVEGKENRTFPLDSGVWTNT